MIGTDGKSEKPVLLARLDDDDDGDDLKSYNCVQTIDYS